ncbi:hypothetical protein VNO77_15817 [Canavalia gladiata]|uniref:Uncharacterized protein n=1 Tax=Canavalia gladiata TaxID=3824 RepID=A0AAN9QRJ4_CANGL
MLKEGMDQWTLLLEVWVPLRGSPVEVAAAMIHSKSLWSSLLPPSLTIAKSTPFSIEQEASRPPKLNVI